MVKSVVVFFSLNLLKVCFVQFVAEIKLVIELVLAFVLLPIDIFVSEHSSLFFKLLWSFCCLPWGLLFIPAKLVGLIVLLSGQLLGQYLVGPLYLRELVSRIGLFVDIGMELFDEVQISNSNFGGSRISRDVEHLVVTNFGVKLRCARETPQQSESGSHHLN